jgi:DNA-directed RNA polymerase subunit RPC12/RpoP
MFMNLTCPGCGQRCRVPESAYGQKVKCPMCATLIQCGPAPAHSLAAGSIPAENPSPVRVAPPVGPAETHSHQAINYSCPRCSKTLESPATSAGQKVNCPDCGQRLQIPKLSNPPASVPVRIIASPPPAVLPPAAQLPPVKEEPIPTVLPTPARAPAAPAPREHCLECGANITDRPRIQTCPDCGSLFCSAMCYREHQYHAHSSRRL